MRSWECLRINAIIGTTTLENFLAVPAESEHTAPL